MRGRTSSLAALAVLVRLPLFLSPAHVSFDDGVFGLSAVAMRDGAAPFREVFSSQGPLFLPLVWLADGAGLRTANAPRLLGVAAGVALTVGVFVVARRLSGSVLGGTLAAAVTTVCGSVLWVSGPVAADGPALALGVAAVAVALSYRDTPSLGRAVAMGALAGAAFAIKSALAVPPGVVVAWAFLERRQWRHLAAGLASSAVVVVGAALPWGPADVWDQSVDYHLDASDERTPLPNFNRVWSTLWDRDLLVLVALAGGLAAAVRSRRFDGRATGPVLAWVGALFLVYLVEHPMWRPHVAHVVPPLAVLAVVLARDHLPALAVALAVGLVPHAVTAADLAWSHDYDGPEAAAVADLEELPPGALVVSDEPGLVWRAGREAPPDFVDGSMLLVETGRVTRESLEAAARRPAVCALLVWSDRYGGLDPDPPGYEVAARYGEGRRLLTKRACPTGRTSAGAAPAR